MWSKMVYSRVRQKGETEQLKHQGEEKKKQVFLFTSETCSKGGNFALRLLCFALLLFFFFVAGIGFALH